MAEHEHPSTDDELDQVQAREVQRRRQVLRGPGGGRTLVSVPDGGCRSGRTSLKAALRPWQFATDGEQDIDDGWGSL